MNDIEGCPTRRKLALNLAAMAVLLVALLLGVPAARAADCAPVQARLVSSEGTVEWRPATASAWVAAPADASLCTGDMLRTGARSRAALRLANQSTLRLDQLTTLTLLSEQGSASVVDLLRGALHVITRTPLPFRIRTPFVNAGVEGTEFLVRVGDDAAQVIVFEGRVALENARATLSLQDGAAALTARDDVPRAQVVRPSDAVHWALHYPAIFGGSGQNLDAPRRLTRQAERLLRVGRFDEAGELLARALQEQPGLADALALQALVAVVQNDTATALRLAHGAVTADPQSPGAWLTLSYAEQARFDIAAARNAAETATGLAPSDALAWARVAELRLAAADLAGALDAARRAADRADLARTRSVLGFVHLLRSETSAAREAFTRATVLDPSDALPRLGLGLARIRAGELAAGREEIEIAASLDPLNAQVRSYLGKAYQEERRSALAGTQYALARTLDPHDPTPWFLEALLARTQNRPLDGQRALQRSIELNDARAVYRSRLLLDQDAATRQVNLAALYGELGAEREAAALAARSLFDDPSNHSAHRLLSEAYAWRDRHDIARASELLQAQLLQPPSLGPLAPELPFTDLSLSNSFAQSALFASDPISMFERDRTQAQAGLVAGNLGTTGGRVLVSTLRGPVAASVGVFAYDSDGFRPNADLHHRIGNMFVQVGLAPGLSVQAEHRERRSRYGDLAMNFDPAFFGPRDRTTRNESNTRLGLAWSPTPDSTWLASAMHNTLRWPRYFARTGMNIDIDFDHRATALELQWQRRWPGASIVAGAGRIRLDSTDSLSFDFTPSVGAPCPADHAPCSFSDRTPTQQWNGYLYSNWRVSRTLEATLGASYDHYRDSTVFLRRWSPKLGLRHAATPTLTLRAASFGTVKRAFAAQQTLEPTQVMGFNQFYDDVVGAVSRFDIAAADLRVSPRLSLGIEAGRQHARIGTGTIGGSSMPIDVQVQRTEWLRLQAVSQAAPSLVMSAALLAERFRWDATIPTDAPTRLMTTRVPLTLRWFGSAGYFGEAVLTGVSQRVERLPDAGAPTGRDRFAVVDLSFGWRIPGQRGTLSLDVKNLFDSRFFYQDDNFRGAEARLSPYLPVRRFWLRAAFAL